MKKKLLPALLLLFAAPSCILVVSESDECEYCRNQAEHAKQHQMDDDADGDEE